MLGTAAAFTCQHEQMLGNVRCRNPGLLAVDDILVTIARGPNPNAAQVGASTRLTEGYCLQPARCRLQKDALLDEPGTAASVHR